MEINLRNVWDPWESLNCHRLWSWLLKSSVYRFLWVGKALDDTWSTQVNLFKARKLWSLQNEYMEPIIPPWTWQGEGPEVLNHFFLEVKLGHVWVKSAEKDVSNHCVLGWDAGHKVRTASGPWTVAFCVPIFASLSLVFSLTQEDNSIWRKQVGFWHHWGWHCSLGNGGASFFFFSDPSSKGKMLWPSVKDFSLSTGNNEMSSLERGFTFI